MSWRCVGRIKKNGKGKEVENLEIRGETNPS